MSPTGKFVVSTEEAILKTNVREATGSIIHGRQTIWRRAQMGPYPGNNSVSATVGDSAVLTCPHRPNMNLVTWKISPKVGGPCALGYRADQNKTDRTNCSDSLNWKFRPDHDPALEIRQVGVAHEGNYTCEVAAKEGNFHQTYHL
ncbi:PREDICTED: cell surface glycoprotein CD200 receptor 1-A-like, partial [Apaloderma vittatum]|uniref:cell surface glycoprotein CD200 receptor 1-A-like n=1 Tax=Apaloderma vittatum TaxID=57397 RepID=UPI000521C36E